MTTRCYSELSQIDDFLERFEYLKLGGIVGSKTFGHERWMNQRFYRSQEWRQIRHRVVVRDMGNDLGVDGYEIQNQKIYIHHMNPMTPEHLIRGDLSILDPEYLITTTHHTHNAIHYGDESLLDKVLVERVPGDTLLWKSLASRE